MKTNVEMNLAEFEEELFDSKNEIYDPEGVHHEFSQGIHGRKIDFEKVGDLYIPMIRLKTEFMLGLHAPEILGRTVLVSVANGTHEETDDVAASLSEKLDRKVHSVRTCKLEDGKVELTEEAIDTIHELHPILAVANEDVVTRGTSTASAILSIHENRPKDLIGLEVVATVLRNVPQLLKACGIRYHAMIDRKQLDYSAAQCQDEGYCAQSWELISYRRR